jgi:hypothetical protein
MIEMNDFEIVLLMAITYLLGLGSGLGFCARYRNVFLQRSTSTETGLREQYNHHQPSSEAMDRVQHVQGFAPSAPPQEIVNISLK